MDLSQQALESAREEASAKGVSNIDFVVADLGDFDESAEPKAFDLITTFDAIHDQAKPVVSENSSRAQAARW